MVYFDHHAATPPIATALQSMEQARAEGWANPSSVHAAGQAAKRILERARAQVAASLRAETADVVFTSGGTEACHLGMLGLSEGCRTVVTTRVEHPAVVGVVDLLESQGVRIVRLDVLGGMPPSVEALREVIDDTTLVAVQWVNHETGTVFPIEAYAAACEHAGARLFVDGTQALGKVPVDVATLFVDALAVTSQKVGGPTGAGACWVRRQGPWRPGVAGGGQERGRRPGTPDVATLAGFGAACEAVGTRLQAQPRIADLRDQIETHLQTLGGVRNSVPPRVATVTNLSFRDWKAPELVAAMDLRGVCIAAGAACSSGLQEPSPVLLSMYPDEQWRARSAVRLSFGPETVLSDIDRGSQIFSEVIPRAQPQT